MNKETVVIKPELLAYDPKIKGHTEAELEYISKYNCKYCHGKGYERWLSGRIKHPDGSIEESFEDRQCRCIRIKVVNVIDTPNKENS